MEPFEKYIFKKGISRRVFYIKFKDHLRKNIFLKCIFRIVYKNPYLTPFKKNTKVISENNKIYF